MAAHLVVDISGHGLGHLGQMAPVVHALKAAHPDVHLTVRCAHPPALLREFLGHDVACAEPVREAAMVMHGPAHVDVEGSASAYRALHGAWAACLADETARLAALKPSALVSDIPYLSLAAAHRLGIPKIALCSLNWADIYQAYCGHTEGADVVLAEMTKAYRFADLFLQPQPHMPMSDLPNGRPIGPLARIGRDRGEWLRSLRGIYQEHKIVLVSLGGIPAAQKLHLPKLAGVHWLVGSSVAVPAEQATDVADLGLPFIDLLASSDAVVTKVGYSTFVEAACNGVALLCARRDDWPETPYLGVWAEENANFAWVRSAIDCANELEAALSHVLSTPPKPAVRPTGISEALEAIAEVADLTA